MVLLKGLGRKYCHSADTVTVIDFTDGLKPASPDGATTIGTERTRSDIPVNALSEHLLTREYIERQKRILSFLEKDDLFNKKTQYSLSRPDRYRLGLARAKRAKQFAVKHGWDEDVYKMAEYLIDDVSPLHLHLHMFMNTIREQASDEQRAYWLPKIESWEVIGAYAQTELGHGSNTKEFIMHSPTLTASKWWNGTLGRTANHAVVMAQLKIPDRSNGKLRSFGLHPFIMQVRDFVTHQPPKTIIVGDIGPKMGYASMDNAYMLFDNHRIPHSAMLSRFSRLDLETNEYVKPPHQYVVYGSLTAGRVNIILQARIVLARAVTVAVRYVSIRRQFVNRDTPEAKLETAVLDYPTVQIRVLPLLATSFALHYTGKAMKQLFDRVRSSIEQSGDFAELADLHSTSLGLKSLCTTYATDGIETCRRAMGGHGFSAASGLVRLRNDYGSRPTVEGDNWMITQQVAQYLLKKMKTLEVGSGTASTTIDITLQRFLQASNKTPHFPVLDYDEAILAAFEWRSSYLVSKAYQAREVRGEAHTSLLVQFYRLSNAYSQSILVNNFHAIFTNTAGVSDKPPQGATEVLHDLFRLYALYTIEAEAKEFLQSGALSMDVLELLPGAIQSLMDRIRPHAVRLVDSWGIPDFLLDSALGRYDGKVYEDLFDRAHRQNPLNDHTFNNKWWSDEIELGSGDAGKILAKL
ncbi:hypothetical protein M409DRAFT_66087 [Zasmidium cellare ATCC 36951]|uniref:Acyl-coenzyme A oxidase n=1 Tax=Zasmidium cellare ATCC 36951 TaxID=1080233 RepID=A0A6A6CN02_ZASCE|nr:uncharacterized protein M409DRAFT_66087 [Zasmidium cellare ATCC 36951]KAF2167598.1 hypothetical protein M409DRAFT_66087 [Zasmidium cellare ATCC 36951]